MIIDINNLSYNNLSTRELKAKVKALETNIRNYTNNAFVKRGICFKCNIVDGVLDLSTTWINVNDTIIINNSNCNDGFYNVESTTNGIELDSRLFDEDDVEIYLCDYDYAIKNGIISLLRYDDEHYTHDDNVAGETIGRHTVNYVTKDTSNSRWGYPTHLLSFIEPYKKPRF